MRDVGKNIKQIRLSKNMTQDSLADALYVTRQTVSNYENGRSRPDLDMLVRIAEIFDTDVNTLIYGPPVPESKKAAYKRLAISVFLLLLTGGLYLIINIIISDYLPYKYYQTWLLNELVLLPIVMFIFGWTLMQLLGIFCNLHQPRIKHLKAIRISALIIFGLWITLTLPYVIFIIIAQVCSLLYSSVEMIFPRIPVYQEIAFFIIKLTRKAPFIYTLFGALFWILGIPNSTAKTAEKRQTA